MTRDGTSRSLRRGVVALLAAWMAVFAVIAAVHNHGILGFTARHATLDQSVAGSAQVASCDPAGPRVAQGECRLLTFRGIEWMDSHCVRSFFTCHRGGRGRCDIR